MRMKRVFAAGALLLGRNPAIRLDCLMIAGIVIAKHLHVTQPTNEQAAAALDHER